MARRPIGAAEAGASGPDVGADADEHNRKDAGGESEALGEFHPEVQEPFMRDTARAGRALPIRNYQRARIPRPLRGSPALSQNRITWCVAPMPGRWLVAGL